MKKQIFILSMFTLAMLFAGVRVYGQTKNPDAPNIELPSTLTEAECLPAVPLTCIVGGDNAALTPIPGQSYTYTVEDIGTVTKVESIRWFVYDATADRDIFDQGIGSLDPGDVEVPGSSLFVAAAGTTYNIPSSNFPDDFSIDITWKFFDASQLILLVAYVKGDECADNIEAYRIRPTFSFTLDIASLMPDGSLNRDNDNVIIDAERCVSPVWSATYNETTNPPHGQLDMDYGANYVYFVVNAANFVDSWEPEFAATHSGGSAIASIAWAELADASGNDLTKWHFANASGIADAVTVQGTGNSVGENGECIVVRVEVEHGGVENFEDSYVELIVNGNMYDGSADNYPSSLADLDDVNGNCEHDPIADRARFNLTPRPKIEEVEPTPFVDKP